MKHLRPWRLALVMLATVLALTMWLPSAQAAETETLPVISASRTWENPLYASGDDPAVQAEAESVVYRVDDLPGAVEAVRKIFKKRIPCGSVVFPVEILNDFSNEAAVVAELWAYEDLVFQEALAHTGKGDEGDYLRCELSGGSIDIGLEVDENGYFAVEDGAFLLRVTYYLNYHSNAAQEAAVAEFVPAMLSTWHLENATDYEKVCAVYDWLCGNVTYSEIIYEGPNTIYSAYGAIMEWECVCQGYAAAAYRMLLELGVDCRIVTGIGNGGRHAWNIVKLGDYYYNMDATWDAPLYVAGMPYNWFLTSDDNFLRHQRDSQFMTASFYAAYPMGPEDYASGGNEEEACQFLGTSVSLGDSLDMHFFFTGGAGAAYAMVTRYDGYGQTVDAQLIFEGQWDMLDGVPYVTYTGIDSKEMGDLVSVTIMDYQGNAISETYTDSIQAYAMRMLEQESDPELLTLLVDMLNYGAQAQTYFGYMEESLVNANLTETQRSYASIAYEVENLLEAGAGRAATALSLKNRITLDLFFDSSVMDAAYSAVVKYTDHNGQVCTMLIWPQEFKEAKGNRICVSVPGLAIADYGQAVTCTVYDAEGNAIAWVTDSIGGYVARMEENIPEIVSAIAKFGNAAYNYFHD